MVSMIRVEDITQMFAEYYSLRGWDEDGVPLEATLERLEL